MTKPVLKLENVCKSFCLHLRSSEAFEVLRGVSFQVFAGECVVLDGNSGMGKSTILKMIYGNYKTSSGQIWIENNYAQPINISQSTPRELMLLRESSMNYVSQFLRTIPRVGAYDLIKQKAFNHLKLLQDQNLLEEGIDPQLIAQSKAEQLLDELRLPKRLWHLPPATFSGGEQQRINLALSLVNPKPLLLLDEPSASLDTENAQIVIDLIRKERSRGTAILGIFHDPAFKQAVTTRSVSMHSFQPHL